MKYQLSLKVRGVISVNKYVFKVEIVSLTPNPQAGGLLLVGFPRLHI